MSAAALALWIFLGLLIVFIGLVLAGTWYQVREESARLNESEDR